MRYLPADHPVKADHFLGTAACVVAKDCEPLSPSQPSTLTRGMPTAYSKDRMVSVSCMHCMLQVRWQCNHYCLRHASLLLHPCS